MKTFSLATLFLPEWVLPWVGVFGIIAWIVGPGDGSGDFIACRVSAGSIAVALVVDFTWLGVVFDWWCHGAVGAARLY